MSEYPKQIYAIYPLDKDGNITGVYVGSAWSVHDRIKNHLYTNGEKDSQNELHTQMRLYGFRYQVLGRILTKETSYLEYVWVEFFNTQGLKTYNIHLTNRQDLKKHFDEIDRPIWTGAGVICQYCNQSTTEKEQLRQEKKRQIFEKSYLKYSEISAHRRMKDSRVAELAGITPSTFSDWKSGRSKPKTEKLIKIAAVLEVPLETFFEEKE